MKPKDLLERIERGDTSNIAFDDLRRLVEALGFELDRSRGSHLMFWHPAVRERVNIQPLKGQAKSYQVRQVADIAARYSLGVENRK